MKKGFTLIELLIVMVIVGTLVAIALPKYQAALERGRAQEAFANLKAASELINTYYVLSDNDYAAARDKLVDSNGDFLKRWRESEFTKSRHFTAPHWLDNSVNPTEIYQSVWVGRRESENSQVYEYTLTARNAGGALKDIVCSSSEAGLCEKLGMDYDETEERYKISFTN